MGYKIYFKDSPLYLTSKLDEKMNSIIHHDDGIFMDDFSHQGMKSMIHEMKIPAKHGGVFLYQDEDALFLEFKKNFDIISAGGGIVFNEDEEILMIYRREKWDLPKGKLDIGETIEECAIREVQEECGIEKLEIIRPLITTYHVYDEFGKHYLKETHWFLMKTTSYQELKPQLEEQITAIEWVTKGKINEKLNHTYAQIKDIIALI